MIVTKDPKSEKKTAPEDKKDEGHSGLIVAAGTIGAFFVMAATAAASVYLESKKPKGPSNRGNGPKANP